MTRGRPYIPIAVRLQVAKRQFAESGKSITNFSVRARELHGNIGKRELLTLLLKALFPDVKVELDHDPALILRQCFRNGRGEIVRYVPDANDPAHLVWREKALHQEKTTGRRPGASHTITTKGSDIGLKTKFARLERPTKTRLQQISRTKHIDTSDIPEADEEWFRKAKVQIPSRPFRSQKRKIGR